MPEKCVIASGSGLFCANFAADDTPQIWLQIHNILDKTVTIEADAVLVEFANRAKTCTGPAAQTTIAADTTETLALASGATCTIVHGDEIKGDIIITHTPEGGLQKSTTGQIVTFGKSIG